ncbi:hypothetical protein NCG89_06640 [Spongiibacter taiwanensis]|uniref:hypothetical protein n=1 Tax=Spongiibacter taiwanensis TaxID=1748242 RepID=UPI002034E35A|nr:hypothetical protein [Spongiibacter taiwanensis]USA44446.1 hypothetical protein NCG89_06640 [Spongiibacter taiwanensis]
MNNNLVKKTLMGSAFAVAFTAAGSVNAQIPGLPTDALGGLTSFDLASLGGLDILSLDSFGGLDLLAIGDFGDLGGLGGLDILSLDALGGLDLLAIGDFGDLGGLGDFGSVLSLGGGLGGLDQLPVEDLTGLVGLELPPYATGLFSGGLDALGVLGLDTFGDILGGGGIPEIPLIGIDLAAFLTPEGLVSGLEGLATDYTLPIGLPVLTRNPAQLYLPVVFSALGTQGLPLGNGAPPTLDDILTGNFGGFGGGAGGLTELLALGGGADADLTGLLVLPF